VNGDIVGYLGWPLTLKPPQFLHFTLPFKAFIFL